MPELKIKNFREVFKCIEEIGLSNLISGKCGVNNKHSFGSTNPNMVRKAIAKEERWLRKCLK